MSAARDEENMEIDEEDEEDEEDESDEMGGKDDAHYDYLRQLRAPHRQTWVEASTEASTEPWITDRFRSQTSNTDDQTAVSEEHTATRQATIPVPDTDTDYKSLWWGGPDQAAFPKNLFKAFALQKHLPPRNFVKQLLEWAIGWYDRLPNVAPLARGVDESGSRGRISVCGDTHGQYHSLCHIFSDEVGGFPSAMNKFVFNGDITDRGDQAVEILLVLLSIQRFDDSGAVTILRGNHEDFGMNEAYGFKKEVVQKYGSSMFDRFQRLFMVLPVAAVIEGAVFITHGGLGPLTSKMTIAEINAEDRRVHLLRLHPVLTELLWSDPQTNLIGIKPSSRKIAYHFGFDVTEAFLALNNLSLFIRSHEYCEEGYTLLHNNKLLHVFSASKYCGLDDNHGAVVSFSGDATLDGPHQVVGFCVTRFK